MSLTIKGIVGDGGEQAAVFSVHESDGVAMKVFLEPEPDLGKRLQAMASHSRASDWANDDSVGCRATWPIDIVRETSSGAVVGYVMPLMTARKSLFDVAEPDGAVGTHSQFVWRTLVNACFHLAVTVHGFHERDIVIGDLTPHNLLVSPAGITTVIDCDSMGFSANGVTWPAWHLTDEFAAPERMRAGAGPATRESDEFALALVISQALMCNRSPFRATQEQVARGRTLIDNLRDGDPPLFAGDVHGVNRSALALIPAPVLPLSRRALVSSATNQARRPSAGEWVAALCEVDTTAETCTANYWHGFCAPATECPMCGTASARPKPPEYTILASNSPVPIGGPVPGSRPASSSTTSLNATSPAPYHMPALEIEPRAAATSAGHAVWVLLGLATLALVVAGFVLPGARDDADPSPRAKSDSSKATAAELDAAQRKLDAAIAKAARASAAARLISIVRSEADGSVDCRPRASASKRAVATVGCTVDGKYTVTYLSFPDGYSLEQYFANVADNLTPYTFDTGCASKGTWSLGSRRNVRGEFLLRHSDTTPFVVWTYAARNVAAFMGDKSQVATEVCKAWHEVT